MTRRFLALGFIGGVSLSLISTMYTSGYGTFFHSVPLLLLWGAVAKLLGSQFADNNQWLIYTMVAIIHGVVFMTILPLVDYFITTFLAQSSALRIIRIIGFVLVFVVYAILLLLAFPLKDGP